MMTGLPLFLIVRKDYVGYDETAAVIVAARSYRSARQLASSCSGDEGIEKWIEKEYSTIEKISEYSIYESPDVVLFDVKEG